MGKFRVEARGVEEQSEAGKGFADYREEIAPFDDLDNAIASADACADLYTKEITVVVVEKRDKRWRTHHSIKGKAGHDMHQSGGRKVTKTLADKVKKKPEDS